jgi:dCTP deaminase
VTLLNDRDISALAGNDLFSPYIGEKRKKLENGISALSFGLSHAGYDIRLSDTQFLVVSKEFSKKKGELDPKLFDSTLPYDAALNHDANGSYFRLPPYSYGLGVSLELISMPEDVIGLCYGKSTYARCGIVINVTPIEPGWSGHLTMCVVNTTGYPAPIYAHEGTLQVVMVRSTSASEHAYGDGKYQNAGAKVQLATV